MSKQELTLAEAVVKVVPGDIQYTSYDHDLALAQKLAAEVVKQAVSLENLAYCKQLRAAINKATSQTNQQRITIKKQWSQPLETFTQQVQTITATVADAKNTLDKKIKDIEAMERGQREERLQTLYDQHITVYANFPVSFTEFIAHNPQILNKSVSPDQGEAQLAAFISQINHDLTAIKTTDHAAEVRDTYLHNGYNLADAMATVATKWTRIAADHATSPASTKPIAFQVFNAKDATLVALLLDQQHIKYEKVEL